MIPPANAVGNMSAILGEREVGHASWYRISIESRPPTMAIAIAVMRY
jgi:hypothetical protein